MKFRTFYQHKLWRDKLVEARILQGSIINWRRLNDEEFDQQLRIKCIEEAQEVSAATTQKELMTELADVLEVIDSLCDLHNFTLQDIIAIQTKKREERGGFAGRKFVEAAQHPEGSYGEQYCLANPEKYPEII